MTGRARSLVVACLASLGLASSGSTSPGLASPGSVGTASAQDLIVGSKNFTENRLLAEIVAQEIEEGRALVGVTDRRVARRPDPEIDVGVNLVGPADLESIHARHVAEAEVEHARRAREEARAGRDVARKAPVADVGDHDGADRFAAIIQD